MLPSLLGSLLCGHRGGCHNLAPFVLAPAGSGTGREVRRTVRSRVTAGEEDNTPRTCQTLWQRQRPSTNRVERDGRERVVFHMWRAAACKSSQPSVFMA